MIGKYKTSQSSEIKDKQSDTADLDNRNEVKNSMSESKHLKEDDSTTMKTRREVSNNYKSTTLLGDIIQAKCSGKMKCISIMKN